MTETPQTNGLRALLYKNLFRIIILVVAGIIGWTTFQFKIQGNSEAIAEVKGVNIKQDIEITETNSKVDELLVGQARMQTSLEFLIKQYDTN